MKELTLQIKPVGNHCNLNCSYCYAMPFKSEKFQILDLKLLEKIIKEALSITDNLIISWHGGEPMLAGLDFYKKYMQIIKKYKKENQNVNNMIQTNATLVTDDFAKFFKDNNFIVSVSLDGNKESHNKNRFVHKQKGSFDMVMKGIEILRNNGINPPIISTVSQSTYEDGLQNFDFFIKNGFKEIKYSPVYDSATDNFSISCEKWNEFLLKILDRWLELQDPSIKVREIDEILMWFSGITAALCSNRGMCAKWISVDEVGNIYPCEYLRSTNSYGNIKDIKLEEVFNLDSYINFVKKINYLPQKCKKCKLFNICHNGCPATRINSKNELTHKGKYVYCEQRINLFDTIEKIVNQ